MASSNSNPESREHRALHAVIAICLLIVAQLNILLRPDPAPAKTISPPEAESKSEPPSPAQHHSQEVVALFSTNQPVAAAITSTPVPVQGQEDQEQLADVPELVKSEETSELPTATETDKSPTAFQLIREGNQHLSERSQGKVVQIISNRSHDGITPKSWRVIYYDAKARFKAVEIRFEGRDVTRVFEPGRFLELFSDRAHEPMNPELLNVDSDKALQIALENVGPNEPFVSDSEMDLETGSDGTPIWKINFWGGERHDYRLGEIVLSAIDGSVLKNRMKTMPPRTASLSQINSKILLQKRL